MASISRNPTDMNHAEIQATVLPGAQSDIDEPVRGFELAADHLGIERPVLADLTSRYDQVAAFTVELFPGEIRVRVKNDPEIPNDLYFLFDVRAAGDVTDLAARNDEWHARVSQLPTMFCGMFRLSITVR